MKKLIATVVIAAGLTGGYIWWTKGAHSSSATTQPTSTAEVARGSIFQAVAATGKVESNLDVDIKCKASGEIIKLPYDVSQTVKKGALLVELDTEDELPPFKQAKVALDEAQAKLAQAKQNLVISQQNLVTAKLRAYAIRDSCVSRAADAKAKAERRKELFEQNLTSKEDYDTAQTTADQAAADVETAKAQIEDLKAQEEGIAVKEQDVKLAESEVEDDKITLANAQQRLDDTKVTSPIDGVVSALNVQIGQIISSGITNVGGGTTLLTISDLSTMYVLASVDESDIGQVKLDQPVIITADAYAGKHFSGKVVRIATKGVNVSNVVTVEVKIEVTGKDKLLLKPEMTTNVQIIQAERRDVLTVPVQAVIRKGGKMIATVMKDGKAEDREVKIGMSDGENMEIAEGVEEGDVVVLHKDEAQSKWRADRNNSRTPGMIPGMRRR